MTTQRRNAELVSLLATDFVLRRDPARTIRSVAVVSDPPTDAELTSGLGDVANLPNDASFVNDDSGGGSRTYGVLTDRTNNKWWRWKMYADGEAIPAPGPLTDHDSLAGITTNNHHNQSHVLATELALGADHTITGGVSGYVLRASGATAANFQQLTHADLGSVGVNDHHNQVHVITGSDHTVTGSALDVVGLTGTDTLGILTPSSNPGAASAILKSDTSGYLQLTGLGVGAAAGGARVNVVGTSNVIQLEVTADAAQAVPVFKATGTAGYFQVENTGGLSVYGGSAYLILQDSDASAYPGIYLHRSGGFGSQRAYFIYDQSVVTTILGSEDILSLNAGGFSDSLTILTTQEVGIGTGSPAARLHVKGSADDQQLIVQGHTTQTANLQEWQDSGTTVLTSITPAGYLDFASAGSITTTAGNLTLAPAGDVVLGPVGNNVLPDTGYDVTLGSLTTKYLDLYAAELWVETLVAQDTIATIGGRILVGPTTSLTRDLAAAATTIYVKHNEMASGDRTYMEANGQVEFFAITSGPTLEGAGDYSYTVTRNLDGTGANDWAAGDAMFNTGTTGDGFIDLYSLGGVEAGIGPAIVGNVRLSSTYNDWATHWAIGQLNGVYGYGVATYGVAFGEYGASANHMTIDSTNGIQFYSGTTSVLASLTSTTWTLGATGTGHVVITPTSLQILEGANVYTDLASGVLTLGLSSAEHAVIDGSGVRLYDNATLYATFAATTTIGVATTDHVSISSAGIDIMDNTTVRGRWLTNGNIYIGSDVSTPSTNHFSVFGATTTYNSESMAAGTMLIGDNTASKANIKYASGVLNFRGGTTTQAYISTDGTLTAGGGVVTLNSSGVRVEAATGGIFVGTNSYGFYNGASDIGGLGAYVLAASSANYMSLDMKSVAGRSSSMSFAAEAPTSYFASVSHTAKVTAYGQATINLYSGPAAGYNGRLTLSATDAIYLSSPTDITGDTTINTGWLKVGEGLYVGSTGTTPTNDAIIADGAITSGTYTSAGTYMSAGTYVYATSYLRSGSYLQVGTGAHIGSAGTVYDNDLVVDGGIMVGRTADPGAGAVQYTGALQPYRNSTAYTGYIYIPHFSAPTAWGPASAANKASGTKSASDWSVPANAKAVMFTVAIVNHAAGNFIRWRASSGGNVYGQPTAQVAGIAYQFHAFVPLDSSAQFYLENPSGVDLYIAAIGYFI